MGKNKKKRAGAALARKMRENDEIANFCTFSNKDELPSGLTTIHVMSSEVGLYEKYGFEKEVSLKNCCIAIFFNGLLSNTGCSDRQPYIYITIYGMTDQLFVNNI